jgi:hypothetical protein
MSALHRWLLSAMTGLLALLALTPWQTVQAHSSSNSYLALEAKGAQELTLRADIHLRDVDFTFDLDADRDGHVTWGETLAQQAPIDAWLRQGLALSSAGQACTLGAADLQASTRADGPYLSALWRVSCPALRDLAQADLELRYGLIFERDGLHRALFKAELPGLQTNAVLSPESPQVRIAQEQAAGLAIFGRYVAEGVWHIWIGIDHIVVLLSLLLLAPLAPTRKPVTQWRAVPRAEPVIKDVVWVVTAFTVAHSITLGLSVMKWLEPPADFVEPAIAISVVLAALNNLMGWSALRRWPLAFVFGLVHGFGFASVLIDLGLPASALALSLVGFNIGVELGQLAIVLVFMPLAWLMRNTFFYRAVIVAGGSAAIVVLGTVWTAQRIGLF